MSAEPSPALFDRLQTVIEAEGPLAAVELLCRELEAAEDYQNLFYARLMRKRVELGVSPFPTGPAAELPHEVHEAYEEGIRQAAREIGRKHLDRNDIAKAWPYFRLLGEPEPVRQALAAYQPDSEEDPYPLIDIAWQQAVYPEKGFDLVLDRNGVCSAITMVHSSDLSQNVELRTYCIKRLVRTLHEQLAERVRADLTARGVVVPESATIEQMIENRDELFADDGYHIDTSHLSSVVQLAMHLPPCPELELARELAVYGSRLSPALRGDNDPPFEGTYADYRVYLEVLASRDVEAGLEHFRRKAEEGMSAGYQFPAEVLVNLLVKVGRPSEALRAAARYLGESDEQQLNCPGFPELARTANEYAPLLEVARRRTDPVTFLGALIASRRFSST